MSEKKMSEKSIATSNKKPRAERKETVVVYDLSFSPKEKKKPSEVREAFLITNTDALKNALPFGDDSGDYLREAIKEQPELFAGQDIITSIAQRIFYATLTAKGGAKSIGPLVRAIGDAVSAEAGIDAGKGSPEILDAYQKNTAAQMVHAFVKINNTPISYLEQRLSAYLTSHMRARKVAVYTFICAQALGAVTDIEKRTDQFINMLSCLSIKDDEVTKGYNLFDVYGCILVAMNILNCEVKLSTLASRVSVISKTPMVGGFEINMEKNKVARKHILLAICCYTEQLITEQNDGVAFWTGYRNMASAVATATGSVVGDKNVLKIQALEAMNEYPDKFPKLLSY